ncbi:MAG: hypothetical protein EOP19_31870 [Hyphomicrobiales bacterium]|nr:MAG: hypothetical protein EOP19_31870 [Hyphomicrobiales bacterium]
MTLGTAKRLIGENWERYDGTLGVFIVTLVIAVAAGLTYLVDEPLRALLTKPASASINVSALEGR